MLRLSFASSFAVLGHVLAHGPGIKLDNAKLGIAGFPDCVRAHPALDLGMEVRGMEYQLRSPPRATTPLISPL